MPDIDVRKGQAPAAHTREEFRERFRARFFDPAFRAEDAAIGRLEEIAWQGYCQARKSPYATSDALDQAVQEECATRRAH